MISKQLIKQNAMLYTGWNYLHMIQLVVLLERTEHDYIL